MASFFLSTLFLVKITQQSNLNRFITFLSLHGISQSLLFFIFYSSYRFPTYTIPPNELGYLILEKKNFHILFLVLLADVLDLWDDQIK